MDANFLMQWAKRSNHSRVLRIKGTSTQLHSLRRETNFLWEVERWFIWSDRRPVNLNLNLTNYSNLNITQNKTTVMLMMSHKSSSFQKMGRRGLHPFYHITKAMSL